MLPNIKFPKLDIAAALSLSAWQKSHRQLWTKVLVIMISITFLLPYVSFAFQPGTYPTDLVGAFGYTPLKANGAAIHIKPEWGRVTSSFHGTSNKTIVYIQDLHCNYEVQSNISFMLERLLKKNGLRLVGVEGESTPINVSQLSSIPILEVKKSVGQYFLQRGRITGPEYQSIMSKQPLILQGIESESLYLDNKDTLLKFLNEESQGYCEDLRYALERLKSPLYNIELAKLDHKQEDYDLENITLENYCDFLLLEAKKAGVEIKPYKVMRLYAIDHKLPITAAVDYEKLLAEAQALDRAIRGKYYTSPEQRRLDHYIYVLKIMENLVNISATQKDLTYFRRHREEFKITNLLHFLEDISYRFALHPDMDPGILKMDEYLNLAAKFYLVADERSHAFVENLTRAMKKHQQNTSVLITGGFHAAHVEKALRSQNISFITVKPRITRTDVENPYFSLLRNQKTPLERLLAQNENIFAVRSFFSRLLNFKLNRRYMETMCEIVTGYQLAVKQGLRGDDLQTAFINARKKNPADNPNLNIQLVEESSNPKNKVFVFRFVNDEENTHVVIRPNQTTNYQTMVESEVLYGNNYQFEFVSAEYFKDNRAAILGTPAPKRAGVKALTDMVLQISGITNPITRAIGGLALALGVGKHQPTLTVGLGRLSLIAWLINAGKLLSALGSGFSNITQSMATGWRQWHVNFAERNSLLMAWIAGISFTLLAHSVIMGATPLVPIAFMAAFTWSIGSLMHNNWFQPLASLVLLPRDDLIARAVQWGREAYGFGENDIVSTPREIILERIMTLAQGNPVLAEFIDNRADRLALAGMAYNEGQKTWTAGTAIGNVEALAQDFMEAETLAEQLAAGTKIANLKSTGNSPLAELIRNLQAKPNLETEEIILGMQHALNPERLMPECISPAQREAIKTVLADFKNVKVKLVQVGLINDVDFTPGVKQYAAMDEKLKELLGEFGKQMETYAIEYVSGDIERRRTAVAKAEVLAKLKPYSLQVKYLSDIITNAKAVINKAADLGDFLKGSEAARIATQSVRAMIANATPLVEAYANIEQALAAQDFSVEKAQALLEAIDREFADIEAVMAISDQTWKLRNQITAYNAQVKVEQPAAVKAASRQKAEKTTEDILNRAAPMNKATDENVLKILAANLKILGFKILNNGQAVLSAKAMRQKVRKIKGRIARERKILDKSFRILSRKKDLTKNEDEELGRLRRVLSQHDDALMELREISLAFKESGNLTFDIRVSEEMESDQQVILSAVGNVICFNAKNIPRFSAKKSRAQLMRRIARASGHIEGLELTQLGKDRLNIISKLLAGYKLKGTDMAFVAESKRAFMGTQTAEGRPALGVFWTAQQRDVMKEWLSSQRWQDYLNIFAMFDKAIPTDELQSMVPGNEADKTHQLGVAALEQITEALVQSEARMFSGADVLEVLRHMVESRLSVQNAVKLFQQEQVDYTGEKLLVEYENYEETQGPITSVKAVHSFIKTVFEGEAIAITPALRMFVDRLIANEQEALGDDNYAMELYLNFEEQAGQKLAGLPTAWQVQITEKLRSALDNALSRNAELIDLLIAKKLESLFKTQEAVAYALRNSPQFLRGNFPDKIFKGKQNLIISKMRQIDRFWFLNQTAKLNDEGSYSNRAPPLIERFMRDLQAALTKSSSQRIYFAFFFSLALVLITQAIILGFPVTAMILGPNIVPIAIILVSSLILSIRSKLPSSWLKIGTTVISLFAIVFSGYMILSGNLSAAPLSSMAPQPEEIASSLSSNFKPWAPGALVFLAGISRPIGHGLASIKKWAAGSKEPRMLDAVEGEAKLIEMLKETGNAWIVSSDVDSLKLYNNFYGKKITNVILDEIIETRVNALHSPQVKEIIKKYGITSDELYASRPSGDEGMDILPEKLSSEDVTAIMNIVRQAIPQALHLKYMAYDIKGKQTPDQEKKLRKAANAYNAKAKDEQKVRVFRDSDSDLRLLVKVEGKTDLGNKIIEELNLADEKGALHAVPITLSQNITKLDYPDNGYMLTPTCTFGASQAGRVLDKEEDFKKWALAAFKLADRLLLRGKDEGKNKVVVDDLEEKFEKLSRPPPKEGFMDKDQIAGITEAREAHLKNLDKKDAAGNKLYDQLVPYHFSIDGLKQKIKERLQELKGRDDFEPEIHFARASSDRGPDKILVFVLTPQGSASFKLEGSTGVELEGSYAFEGEENQGFAAVNERYDHAGGNVVISLPHYIIHQMTQANRHNWLNPNDLQGSFEIFVKQLEQEMNLPDNQVEINLSGACCGVSTNDLFAHLEDEAEIDATIGEMFRSLEETMLAKSEEDLGKITAHDHEEHQPLALARRARLGKQATIKLFKNKQAQLRMVKEVREARAELAKAKADKAPVFLSAASLLGLASPFLSGLDISPIITAVLAFGGIIGSLFLLENSFKTFSTIFRQLKTAFTPAAWRQYLAWARANPMIILAIGAGLYALFNPEASGETGYLAAMGIIGPSLELVDKDIRVKDTNSEEFEKFVQENTESRELRKLKIWVSDQTGSAGYNVFSPAQPLTETRISEKVSKLTDESLETMAKKGLMAIRTELEVKLGFYSEADLNEAFKYCVRKNNTMKVADAVATIKKKRLEYAAQNSEQVDFYLKVKFFLNNVKNENIKNIKPEVVKNFLDFIREQGYSVEHMQHTPEKFIEKFITAKNPSNELGESEEIKTQINQIIAALPEKRESEEYSIDGPAIAEAINGFKAFYLDTFSSLGQNNPEAIGFVYSRLEAWKFRVNENEREKVDGVAVNVNDVKYGRLSSDIKKTVGMLKAFIAKQQVIRLEKQAVDVVLTTSEDQKCWTKFGNDDYAALEKLVTAREQARAAADFEKIKQTFLKRIAEVSYFGTMADLRNLNYFYQLILAAITDQEYKELLENGKIEKDSQENQRKVLLGLEENGHPEIAAQLVLYYEVINEVLEGIDEIDVDWDQVRQNIERVCLEKSIANGVMAPKVAGSNILGKPEAGNIPGVSLFTLGSLSLLSGGAVTVALAGGSAAMFIGGGVAAALGLMVLIGTAFMVYRQTKIPAVADSGEGAPAGALAKTGLLTKLISNIKDRQVLGEAAQPGAKKVNPFLLNLRESRIGRALLSRRGMPTGLRLMMLLPSPAIRGLLRVVVAGAMAAAWIGMVVLVGNANSELAILVIVSGIAALAPAKYLSYQLRTTVYSQVGGQLVNSPWMKNKLANMEQNWNEAKVISMLQGLLTILEAVKDNAQAREGVLEVMAQVPYKERKTVLLTTKDGQKMTTRSLPTVIFEPYLAWRMLRIFPSIIIDGKEFKMPQLRQPRAMDSSA